MRKPRTQYQLTPKGMEMAARVASQPGYQDFMTMPLIASILKQNPARQTPQPTPDVTAPKSKKVSSKKGKKGDPNHSTLGKAPVQNLRTGDSEADLLARMFLLQQEQETYYKKQEKIDAKYRKRLDNDKERRLEETINALYGKKPSAFKGAFRKDKGSGLLKYGLIGGALVGGLMISKESFANINFDTIFEKNSGEKVDDFGKTYTEDSAGARTSSEDYLGRKMTDVEYDELIRATSAEAGATSNKKEQSMIMASILNRARDKNMSISDVLREKNQFQVVTGTEKKPGESEQFKKGPSAERKRDIESGAALYLPNVSRKQKQFAAESTEAYGPGTSTTLRDRLRREGGAQVGSTRFETKEPGQVEGLLTPIAGYKEKDISSHKGERTDPHTKQKQNHAGIDMPAPEGTKVIAAHSGKVISGYNDTAGNFVEIIGDGIKTRYLHLKEKPNLPDSVNRGDVIGLVGSTGRSTGPHLHFEVYEKTDSGQFSLKDPENYVKLSSLTEIPELKSNFTAVGSGIKTATTVTNIIQGSTTVSMNNNNKSNRPIAYDVQYGSVT